MATWPVYKDSGRKKIEKDLSEGEKGRILEDLERDLVSGAMRNAKVSTDTVDLGRRLCKDLKDRARAESFEEACRQAGAAKAA